ncbi:MAG: hypothetical protein ACI9T7_003703 [Oleiphilaceae bacterium]
MKVKYTTMVLSVLLAAGNSAAKIDLNDKQKVDELELQSLENISKELVDIRQQISSLHDEINFKKESFSDQLRSYSNQKSDLNVKISRADLNLRDLQRELDKLKAINDKKFEAYDEVTPVLKSSISTLRASVKTSLPYKLDARLRALDDIEYRLNTNIISPNKAANQLWAFVEDELILGRSSGIYSESLNVDGEDKLVKVLRLGKIAMFYQTSNASYGVVRQHQGVWKQDKVLGDDNTRQLDYLFDSFNKNIRNGLFTVPNFLPNN